MPRPAISQSPISYPPPAPSFAPISATATARLPSSSASAAPSATASSPRSATRACAPSAPSPSTRGSINISSRRNSVSARRGSTPTSRRRSSSSPPATPSWLPVIRLAAPPATSIPAAASPAVSSRPSRASPLASLRLRGAYTFTNSEFRRSAVRDRDFFDIPFTSPHQFSFVVTQRIGRRIDLVGDFWAANRHAAIFSSRAFLFSGPRKLDLVANYTFPVARPLANGASTVRSATSWTPSTSKAATACPADGASWESVPVLRRE